MTTGDRYEDLNAALLTACAMSACAWFGVLVASWVAS